MDMEDNVGNSGMQWIDEHYDSPLGSTISPELLLEEGSAIGSLVIIVVAVFMTIVLLFMMAVFIDCRQQKLSKLKNSKTRRVLQVPRVCRRVEEDQENFAEKMQISETTPPVEIV